MPAARSPGPPESRRNDMLLPEEAAQARHYLARIPRYTLVTVLITLALAAVPTLIYVSFDGHLDHLLGKDKQVTAMVDDVRPDGTCGRSRNTDHRVEVSWMDDGERRSGVYYHCKNAPVRGSTIQVWAGPSGHVAIDSPATDRAGLTALSVILAGIALTIGTSALTATRNQYRQLLLQGHQPLSRPIAVELNPAGKGSIKMKHAAPDIIGTKRSRRVRVMFHRSASGKTSLSEGAGIWGTWWLQLTRTTERKKQIGLLTRGNERCWVYFRRR
ncbi:MAG TPA: hypothetical protein H9902_05770 [Candidatus Stackebrandtia faecavium]|nr:hypothetical protein [Candidatus Stackebrandtia faecavium]